MAVKRPTGERGNGGNETRAVRKRPLGRLTRAGSPRALKEFFAPYILAPEAVVAEPITFEVLRHATEKEIRPLQAQFELMPSLDTPKDFWNRAAMLGQRCRRKGVTAGSMDLLIVSVAIHHDAELITFDSDFKNIARRAISL